MASNDILNYLTQEGYSCYSDYLPQGMMSTTPTIVISRDSESPDYTMDGIEDSNRSEYTIEIASFDQDATASTGDDLRSLLASYRGVMGGIYTIWYLTDDSDSSWLWADGSDKQVFLRRQEYEVYWSGTGDAFSDAFSSAFA